MDMDTPGQYKVIYLFLKETKNDDIRNVVQCQTLTFFSKSGSYWFLQCDMQGVSSSTKISVDC